MRRLALFLTFALSASLAAAQGFPTKTVRFISGVTPGSASDTMARLLAEKLSQSLGQPVIVENRLGAGGLVGARYVAQQAEPDGHTIMMYASAFTVSTLLNPGLDPKEMQPLAMVATIPTVLITPPGRYKSLQEFVATAKAQPGKLVCSTAAVSRKRSPRRRKTISASNEARVMIPIPPTWISPRMVTSPNVDQ